MVGRGGESATGEAEAAVLRTYHSAPDCHPRESGEPVIAVGRVTLGRLRILGRPSSRAMTAVKVRARALHNFRIQMSNSRAFTFPRRRASWSFSSLPSTLRGDGAPKGAPW
jgi:hypothetical protein